MVSEYAPVNVIGKYSKYSFQDVNIRGHSYVDFRTQCIIMTLAGGRVITRRFENLSNFKFLDMSFISLLFIQSSLGKGISYLRN